MNHSADDRNAISSSRQTCAPKDGLATTDRAFVVPMKAEIQYLSFEKMLTPSFSRDSNPSIAMSARTRMLAHA
ncbi:hypothetical protein [Dyella nitratireducens]|uniref:hypothetical protein n=1 Tax=Dyella nitratireducens TaxID=1849580 RepID=UPI001666331C|nr:hypothetical protein [Dyella nitratireducens]